MYFRNVKTASFEISKKYKLPNFKSLSTVSIEKIDNKKRDTITKIENNEIIYTEDKSMNKRNPNLKFFFESKNLVEKSFEYSTKYIKKLNTTWRDVIHIKFNQKIASELDYKPGDSLGIHCPNSDVLVDQILEILKISNGGQFYRFERKGKNSNKNDFVFEGRIRDFFKYIYDFRAIPKKSFLFSLANSTNGIHKERLEFLCSREGSNDYFKLYTEWHTLIDVIMTFDCNPTLDILIEHCEVIKKRYFSLINGIYEPCEILFGLITKNLTTNDSYKNSLNHCSNNATFTEKIQKSNNLKIKDESIEHDSFNTIKDKEMVNSKPELGLRRIKQNILFGQCSEYFYNLEKNKAQNISLSVCFRENKLMRLKKSKKLLLISTGTGIAPFISFIKNIDVKSNVWLIYGCRSKNDDLSEYIEEKILKNKELLFRKNVNFSNSNQRVNNFIIDNITEIKDYTMSDCFVYVCGSLNMQKDVLNIFKENINHIISDSRIFIDNWS